MHDDYEIKSLHIMLPKTSAYIKSYDSQTRTNIRTSLCLSDMMTFWKNIKLFGIKSALISKKVFYSNPVYNKNFLKIKIKSRGDEVGDFHNKEISKMNSDHTCLALINVDSALKGYLHHKTILAIK